MGSIHLIINPISGWRTSPKLAALIEALRRGGTDLVEQPTQRAGHATELAAQAAAAGAAAVLVYGGDGTVREVADGLNGSPTPLYHLPGGNENLFAKHFRMTMNQATVLAALRAPRTHTIDLADLKGLTCVSCLGVGFDAQVVQAVHKARTGHVSDLNYVGPIWRTFWSYKFPDLAVRADGREIFAGRGMVFAGNLTRYAAGLPLFCRAKDDDGLLDVAILPCQTRAQILGHVMRVLLRRHDRSEHSIYLRAARLDVTGSGAATQVDGEVGPELPLSAVIRPKALNVLLP